MIRLTPPSTLFPYTTLFRSAAGRGRRRRRALARHHRRLGHRIAAGLLDVIDIVGVVIRDRKSTRLNSSHTVISYAVFCLKKKRQYSSAQDEQENDSKQKNKR